MTKNYKHVTPEMVERVKDVIADSVKHKYSVSKVYGVANAVFERNEKPQTCGSCLQRLVRDLKRWLAEYEKEGNGVSTPFAERDNVKEYENVLTGEKAYYEAVEVSNEGFRLRDEEGNPAPDGEYSYEGADVPAVVIDGYAVTPEVIQPQYDDPDAPGFVPPALGVTRVPMAEGLPIDFTPEGEDPNKGKAVYADGTKVKPGTYATATGAEIAVQPGGKASIKNPEEDLT